MEPSATTAREQLEQAQLRRHFHWTTVGIAAIATAIAALDILSRVASGMPPVAPITVFILIAGLAAGVANRLVPRGQIWPGILLITGWAAVLVLYIAPQVGEIFTALIVILGVCFTLPYVTSRQLRLLTVGGLVVGVAGLCLAQDWSAGSAANALIRVGQRSLLLGLILWLLWLFHQRLHASLAEAQGANGELDAIRHRLEDQVAARTADLQQAFAEVASRAADQARMLEELDRKERVIRELSVPVLPVAADVLVMPLIGNLDADRLNTLMGEALAAIARRTTRFLILDITGVPMIDSQVAQSLIATVQAVRLLGARSLLVGVRPEVAQTIVGLNLQIEGMLPFGDLQAALAFALAARQANGLSPG